MPGIVTHARVIEESVALLRNRKKKSFLLRSMLALFGSKEFLRAAMYGALGPNIFDYFPAKRSAAPFGSDISFFLHDGGSHDFIQAMIHDLLSYDDKNNEWAATQRAYLYGFISHIIADAVFHPFVFYFSGFPDTGSKAEARLYREQNLLFQYNIDNYYMNYADERTVFSLDSMLPGRTAGRSSLMNQAIKGMIISAFEKSYPEMLLRLRVPALNRDRAGVRAEKLTMLDVIPWTMRRVYRVKFTKNERLRSLVRDLRKGPLLFTDYFTCYPRGRAINRHALNLHGERWQYPAERTGFVYDSVDSLMKACCETTVGIWEKIEAGLYGSADLSVFRDLKVNAYTGGAREGYYEMKHKSPIRLRY